MALDRHARFYLLYLRQLVTVTCTATYGVFVLASPSSHVAERMLVLFAIATALVVPYALLLKLQRPELVIAVTTAADMAMIALLVWGTGVPQMLSVALLWPVALASYFLSPRYSVPTAVCAIGLWLVAAAAAHVHLAATAVVPNVLALLALSTLLVYLGARVRSGARQIERERDCDAAVLRLSATMAQEADATVTLEHFVRDIALALHADRCVLRVFDEADTPEVVVEWHARDVASHAERPLHPEARELAMAGDMMWMTDANAMPADRREQLREQQIGSGIGMPIIWDGRTIALLSLQHRAARVWHGPDEDMLVRVAPTVAAVLQRHRMISQQRSALETTRELADLRERLVAMTSHELRTPLTIIIGYLETLAAHDTKITAESLDELLRAASSSAHKLERIVDDLLVLSKMRSTLPPLRFERASIADILERIAPYAHGNELEVQFVDEAEADHELVVDGDRLAQVLGNLVENAVRHGGGRVSIEVAERSGWFLFAVGDAGPGVPREHLAEIFLPFVRFSTRSDSTGMGLSVARAICEAHGGSLHYRAPDNGSAHAFVASLPARAASQRDGDVLTH